MVFLQYESAHYALQFEIVTIYGRVIYIQIILWNSNSNNCHIGILHHKCTDCRFFGKLHINHINVILLVLLQINLVYVRLFTEICKQTESSYKRLHICKKSTFFDLLQKLQGLRVYVHAIPVNLKSPHSNFPAKSL